MKKKKFKLQKPPAIEGPWLGDLQDQLNLDSLTEFELARDYASRVNPERLAEEIRRQPIVANATWGCGTTLLHLVAGQGWCELVELLLRLGANVNAWSGEGIPLHYAVRSGSLAVVKMLVEAGSELNRQESRGLTPLDVANCPAHAYAIMKYLVSRGAGANEDTTREDIKRMKESGFWDEL